MLLFRAMFLIINFYLFIRKHKNVIARSEATWQSNCEAIYVKCYELRRENYTNSFIINPILFLRVCIC